MSTKAVRFSEEEDKAIKEFLENNPFLDFSSMARLAISKFIENPEITLKPTNSKKNKSSSNKVRIQ